MNADLEKIVNSVLINGEISDRSRELLMKKAEQMGENLIDFELELQSKISQDSTVYFKRNSSNLKNSENVINETFGFPLWLVGLINAITLLLHIAFEDFRISMITGLFCAVCVFVALKHWRKATEPLFKISVFSPRNLLFVSVLNTIWMLYFGFGYGHFWFLISRLTGNY